MTDTEPCYSRSTLARLAQLFIVLPFVIIAFCMVIGVQASSFVTSAAQLHQLEQGEILVAANQEEGPTRGMVEATILIKTPAEPIWQVMTDCDEVPTFVPGVESCEVLEAGENWEQIRHEVEWIWLFPNISYVFLAEYIPLQQIRFNRLSGDLKEMRGRWRLQQIDTSKTLLRYSVYLDPGFLVPQWLVRSSLENDLPEVLESLRQKVLSMQVGQEQKK